MKLSELGFINLRLWFSPPLFVKEMRNYGFHPKEIEFKELKSCLVSSNQVGIKPDISKENQEIDLEYLPGHGIDRSIIRDRSICMKRSLPIECNGPGRSVYAPHFLFCIMTRIDRFVRPCNFGLIDSAWSNSLFIILKFYNFKGIITILEIISLMRHKVYEISLKGYSYYFFAQKK